MASQEDELIEDHGPFKIAKKISFIFYQIHRENRKEHFYIFFFYIFFKVLSQFAFKRSYLLELVFVVEDAFVNEDGFKKV